jgi:hypothetical protein
MPDKLAPNPMARPPARWFRLEFVCRVPALLAEELAVCCLPPMAPWEAWEPAVFCRWCTSATASAGDTDLELPLLDLRSPLWCALALTRVASTARMVLPILLPAWAPSAVLNPLRRALFLMILPGSNPNTPTGRTLFASIRWIDMRRPN